ncbi:MAG TPA: glycoside hydrolase family 38 C-terminal domain-containing protein, partial [Acetobacteraceae bacterium]|nr:glycoside hydrolase family 38 C-terminal domain-containing protein [Acetobacteraceae bacterium]
RELIPPGAVGNLLQLHPDFPADWDAWDIDAFYRNTREDLVAAERIVLEHAGPDETALRIERSFGRSRAVQTIRLARGERRVEFSVEIDWQEQERLLKLAFPFDLAAPCETGEIQFGHVSRPTHQNTSWDAARFELCAHRFIHLAEAGYGVAVANDASYGHDVTRQPRPGGGVSTVLRHSLLRGPRFPDPGADRGVHRFGFALAPGATLADAVAEGCRLNLPLRRVRGAHPAAPLVCFDHPAVIVEAVKLAEDRSGDLIVRCYESLGGRVRARCTAAFPLLEASRADLLERDLGPIDLATEAGDCFDLPLRPFEIATLRLRPAIRAVP